jgi:hypothetical protein
MHGEQENSKAPRIACTVLHVAFLGMAAWIYFGGGIEFITGWVGSEPKVSGNLARRIMLFSFSVVLFLRICLTLFYLLKRRFGWEEFWGVIFALFVYHEGQIRRFCADNPEHNTA